MRKLTVLYDAQCTLCQRARAWLKVQSQIVPLEFIPAGSGQARHRFPELDPESTRSELTVVGDGGEVWRGAKAWLMCLWALRNHRETALAWSTPQRLPLARRLVAWISSHRFRLGTFLPQNSR